MASGHRETAAMVCYRFDGLVTRFGDAIFSGSRYRVNLPHKTSDLAVSVLVPFDTPGETAIRLLRAIVTKLEQEQDHAASSGHVR